MIVSGKLLKSNRVFLVFCIGLMACSRGKPMFEGGRYSRPEVPSSTAEDPNEMAPLSFEDLPVGGGRLINLAEISSAIGLRQFHDAGRYGADVKIAVLDNGFAGLSHSLGRRLPPETRSFPGSGNPMQNTTHGLKLAEIAYAVATGSPVYSPERPGPTMLLLNANGYTNLINAIDRVIDEQVDLVLYAQVWEYGGNLEGDGFINAQVRRATNRGILWVNAAGNLGQSTYKGPVKLQPDLSVTLPSDGRYVRFVVPGDDTPVKIVLAWNDFADTTSYHTSQDLDLYLERQNGEIIGESRWVQDGTDPENDERYSAHAREILRSFLNAGTYYLRVQAKSENFTPQSTLWLTVSGPGVKMLDGKEGGGVLIPADNPQVLTVGATDVTYGSELRVAGRVVKPEFKVPSEVRFSDGEQHRGTSAASAIAAGALAVLMDHEGVHTVTKQNFIDKIRGGQLSFSDCNEPCSEAPVFYMGN